MQTKINITAECDCGETMKKGMLIFHDDNEIPELSYDTASCDSFHCDSCDKNYYTGDFDLVAEEDI
jgi:redox-regulated HSP33 family molecular chaperone